MFDMDYMWGLLAGEEEEMEVSEYTCPNDDTFLAVKEEGYLYVCLQCGYHYRRISSGGRAGDL